MSAYLPEPRRSVAPGRPIRWRLVGLAAALLAVFAALFRPSLPLSRETYRYLFVLDITQSMNAQDYHVPGLPSERLGYAREAIRQILRQLPCGSAAGLGLFTTQSVQILFEPIEVCEHLAVIEDTLSHVDWRMAWAGDSHVAQGLYAVLRELQRRDPRSRLVFFTDGQETPPLNFRPRFDGQPGGIQGVIVGVGGTRPVPVPRYDRDGRLLGYWENADIATPPVATTDYSDKVETPPLPRQGLYLSWVDEAHLRELAAITGLEYHRLEDFAPLSRLLRESRFSEHRRTSTDLRPALGLLALALVLAVHGAGDGLRSKESRIP